MNCHDNLQDNRIANCITRFWLANSYAINSSLHCDTGCIYFLYCSVRLTRNHIGLEQLTNNLETLNLARASALVKLIVSILFDAIIP